MERQIREYIRLKSEKGKVRPAQPMTRRMFIAGIATFVPFLAAGCSPNSLFHSLHFRLTVSGMFDGAYWSGHTIIHKIWIRTPLSGFDGLGYYDTKTWAQALILRAPRRSPLFGLLMLEDAQGFSAKSVDEAVKPYIPANALTDEAYKNGSYFEAIAGLKGEYALDSMHQLTIVKFRALTDSASVKVISTERLVDEFPNGPVCLMPGNLKGTIAVADGPPVTDIRRELPWLATHKGGLLPHSRSRWDGRPLTPEQRLNSDYFLL